jgi:hypothetical protein
MTGAAMTTKVRVGQIYSDQTTAKWVRIQPTLTPTCAELIERIVADATEIIRKRLPAMVAV